jgi:hypothetical protein
MIKLKPMPKSKPVNGLVFQISTKSSGCVPLLLNLAEPRSARGLNASREFADLGIDRVALVNFSVKPSGEVRIERITDVGVFNDGDTTTAKKALDLLVNQGGLDSFVAKALWRE